MDFVIGALSGLLAGYLVRLMIGSFRADAMEKQAKIALGEARRASEEMQKEGRIQAKAEVLHAREEFERSTRKRKDEFAVIEERINKRETNLDRKVAMIDKKEHVVEQKLENIEERAAELLKTREEADRLLEARHVELQRVAGMGEEQARQELLERTEKEVRGEVGGLIRRLHDQAKETANREAQRIVAMAVQRYSGSHASETMTSTVMLPSDDMKGRIIGRDGRNIRALEAATGVNILIDDTPEAVVVTGFDPVRREVARLALQTLVSDGRIHPARIEEVVAKTGKRMDDIVRAAGEEAAFSAGVQAVNPELLQMVGRLKFRTSYSQNVLQHSLEVAALMGVMAGELGLDVSLAKRIGLFHDIGKAVDHEIEGGHALIGADMLKKHSEGPVVVNAVAAHHEEVESESVYALLAKAGDAISSSRPGARVETTSIYVKRLEKLEEIANGFDGVAKSYAIQAGREVRVVVTPDKIDDDHAMILARDISRKIEDDLQYPGQIRVTVIRETRCVEFAR